MVQVQAQAVVQVLVRAVVWPRAQAQVLAVVQAQVLAVVQAQVLAVVQAQVLAVVQAQVQAQAGILLSQPLEWALELAPQFLVLQAVAQALVQVGIESVPQLVPVPVRVVVPPL